jgi:UDP-N-acetylmuramoyl-tripeptide--D-alanyl-D-alanine ligase
MFRLPKYQLYLLQLENYELGRYLKLLFKKGLFPPSEPLRKNLVWTQKALAIFLIAEVFILGLAAYVSWILYKSALENTVALVLTFFVLASVIKFFSFIFFSLAEIILAPLDFIAKRIIVAKAKTKLTTLPDLKVIGIAGSYGKTTMKEVLKHVLNSKYKVLSTPESINTPVGISRWILGKVDVSTEIIIVEMGEHYSGDVKEICELVTPDIVLITGINEAHLERMGNIGVVTETIFEAVKFAKKDALIILNKDDSDLVNNYKKFLQPSQKILFYSADRSGFSFSQQILGWAGNLEPVGEVKIRLLGKYAVGFADASAQVAKVLGVTNQQIAHGLNLVKPVDHRLEAILSPQNILVIDDSYNANPEGVKEAVEVLSRFPERRKIYLTPGLVEMGSKTKEVHLELGSRLANIANVVILIKNSATPDIERGIKNQDVRGKQPEIIWFNSALEAHTALKDILKPGDVILFQNDWGDNYL